MDEHVCSMSLRFKNIEDNIKDLKDENKEHSKDMAILKESHAETKIYIKQILENQATMTATLKVITDKPSKRFDAFITGLITAVATALVTGAGTFFFLSR